MSYCLLRTRIFRGALNFSTLIAAGSEVLQDGPAASMVGSCLPWFREPLVMDFGPLHQLLSFPETVGCQAMTPGIANPIGAIGFGGDGEPRRSGDGVVHGTGGATPYRATPPAPPLGEGSQTVKRLVAGTSLQGHRSIAPPPERMGERFNRRDVHRLDCCHSPVADCCSPGRRRGHDSLLHLALETIGRAVSPPAPGSPDRS